jgi:sec-independent protein translocase protein TatB
MLDFDIGKMLVVAIVALAVIPPKDLPRVMRTVGQVMGRMRRMAAEFQGQFMDAMREVEFDSVRKELAELNQKATAANFDPAAMIRDEVTRAVEPQAHLPAPANGASEIGASEVALSAPPAQVALGAPAAEAKPVEEPAALHEAAAGEAAPRESISTSAKSDAAE